MGGEVVELLGDVATASQWLHGCGIDGKLQLLKCYTLFCIPRHGGRQSVGVGLGQRSGAQIYSLGSCTH